MRIAIITLPLNANYGGILQAFALQTVLKQLGHTVETIQIPYKRKLNLWITPLVYTKRFILKYILGRNVRVLFEHWCNITDPLLVKQMKCFIDRYISVRFINRYSDIRDSEYDAFIVGSDQVWRPIYFGFPIEDAYLAFAKDWQGVKRIAYAASFGTDNWEYKKKQTNICRNLVKLFCAISVREESAVGLCRQYLHSEAQHVLDPTMLLTINDYCKLFVDKQLLPNEGELLTYILDENSETENIVSQFIDKLGYRTFRINSRYEDYNAPLNERIQPPVEQWLKGFHDAKFVVTDSFHATVFSILFGKPFIVIGNKERGLSRLKSLLNLFELENHLIIVGDQMELDMDYSLNTQTINLSLDKLRTKSFDFLNSHLK